MKLTDTEVYDLLFQAVELLSTGSGETVRGETALRAGEKMLHLLQIGLLNGMENGTDDPTRPTRPSPEQLPS